MLPPVRRGARRAPGGPGRRAVVHGPSAAARAAKQRVGLCVGGHIERRGGRYTRMPPVDKRAIAKSPARNPPFPPGARLPASPELTETRGSRLPAGVGARPHRTGPAGVSEIRGWTGGRFLVYMYATS